MYKIFFLFFSSLIFIIGCSGEDGNNRGTNNVTINTTNNITNNTTSKNNRTTNTTNPTNNTIPKAECPSNQRKATVNGVTACYFKCIFGNCDLNQTCNEDELCIDDGMTTDACRTNNDCPIDQRCINEECTTLQFCASSRNEPTLEGCEHVWSSCADGKAYRFDCVARFNNAPATCVCEVDRVVTKTVTATFNEDTCNSENVNELCGWGVAP